MNNQEKTTLRKLLPLIAVIAIPVALQNLLTTTGSMIDTMMLSSLGEKTVGAVGLCAQFTSLMFSGYWGFVGGGMLFFAQYWGAGDGEGIRRSYGMTFCFMMISGLVFGYLAVFQPEAVMNLYTSSEPIQEIGVRYLRVVGWSFPLNVTAMAMSCLLRSIEQVKIPLYGGIAAVVTNCVCNYILIFGKFGFPKLGVIGAAVGTIMASVVNITIIVTCVLVKRIPYLLEFWGHFKWTKDSVKEYLQKCFPIIANEVMIGIGNMLINIVLGHQIDEAIAATAVFRIFEGFIIAFFSGFSNAASVLVGKEVGAGNHEVAFDRAVRIIYLCSAVSGAACFTILALHTPLLHALGLSGESFRLATGMLAIFCFVCIIRMGNWAHNDTFRSAGDPSFGSTLEIIFMFAMVQPVIHLANGPLHLPFLAVFALCYCDEPIRYIMMQFHLYSRKWIRPVSDTGKATIGAFREKYGVKIAG